MEADEYNVTQAIAVERELVDLEIGEHEAALHDRVQAAEPGPRYL
jgi:hypothetical protein